MGLPKILVTGATGFLGRALISELHVRGDTAPIGAGRSAVLTIDKKRYIQVGELGANTDWSEALSGVEVVIHTAARTHIMSDMSADPLSEYRRVNVDGTLGLAKQALLEGVKRFIFISSIKVNGEGTYNGQKYCAQDKPAPEDPYGISKYETELALSSLAAGTDMEVVVIRPPLIYGPGVKGNFALMIKLVERGLPLPLGGINNQRTLVGLDNLVDLVIQCIDNPMAANQVFLAGDDESVSTSELLRAVGKAMDKPVTLVPIPSSVLSFGAKLAGKKEVARRLLGSLEVDITYTCERLGWRPPYSLSHGLGRCFEKPSMSIL